MHFDNRSSTGTKFAHCTLVLDNSKGPFEPGVSLFYNAIKQRVLCVCVSLIELKGSETAHP